MGASPGEESRINGVAAQAIEAQPVFGQIKPSKRPRASACWTAILRRRLGEARLNCTRGRYGSAQKEKQFAAKGGSVPEGMIERGAPTHSS